jgi:hypothetical protein
VNASSMLLPLATKTPDPADVKPGWLGLGMFLALAVAVVLLWLSMRRHLKKVDFEEEPDPPGDSDRLVEPDPEPDPDRSPEPDPPREGPTTRADTP